MKKYLDKLDTLLTLAFQESEGPFSVLIKTQVSSAPLLGSLNKDEIKALIKDSLITNIELSKRIASRRWRSRSAKDRRK